ncbi:hypothetical protein ACFFX0_12730 [Citricoccus parietis]|uniref:Uncharacterized protein n=1 Tax=Citricoccus parietis TaxID=592307 RepID=A0ABV5FZ97_9MICC
MARSYVQCPPRCRSGSTIRRQPDTGRCSQTQTDPGRSERAQAKFGTIVRRIAWAMVE